MSLGVGLTQDRYSIIIPKNTETPCERMRTYGTSFDNQTSVCFEIYQGEEQPASKNKQLGKFTLVNLVPKPTSYYLGKLQVKMEIGHTGILEVSGTNLASGGKGEKVSVEAQTASLPQDKKDQMKLEAAQFEEEEQKFAQSQ